MSPPGQRSRPVGNGAAVTEDRADLESFNMVPQPGDNGAEHAPAPMSKADRGNLERLARKRAKVAKAMIGERVKALRSDVEDQLSAEYHFDDDVWGGITRQASEAVREADARIAEACRRVGVPEDLRPELTLGWRSRGENALASRRAELRKLAHARIDAAAESAKVAIDHGLLEVETELIRDGLETAAAVAYVEAMPTPDELLPPVAVAELEPGASRDRYDTDEYRARYGGGWRPPQAAAGQLLTPSTASNREDKRQAVAAALAADPSRSDRAIAQAVGVDHKTVGKLRAVAGDFPSHDGEVPTEDEATEGGAR